MSAAGSSRPVEAALVTGCSTGIGRAAAIRLHRAGYEVYATARRVEAIADLAGPGMHTMALDVADDAQLRSVVAAVERRHGAVGVLVNNAAQPLAGAAEDVPLPVVRAHFEVNLFGLLRLTQLALPGMRERGAGTVVNVSSIYGKLAVPGGSAYAASKHAVEALSDALRQEVARFGVRVVLVEPGPVRTPFATRAAGSVTGDVDAYEGLRQRLKSWYAELAEGRGGVPARFAVSAEEVARVIERVAGQRHPRPRQRVGTLARGLLALRWMLPDRRFDGFVRRQFPAS